MGEEKEAEVGEEEEENLSDAEWTITSGDIDAMFRYGDISRNDLLVIGDSRLSCCLVQLVSAQQARRDPRDAGGRLPGGHAALGHRQLLAHGQLPERCVHADADSESKSEP